MRSLGATGYDCCPGRQDSVALVMEATGFGGASFGSRDGPVGSRGCLGGVDFLLLIQR